MPEYDCALPRKRGRVLGATVVGVLAVSALLFAAQVLAQRRDTLGLDPGAYPVGFQLLTEQDRSRSVVANDGATHARPIRVYVWYPAKAASKPIRFGRYAALADDDMWPAEISGRTRDVLKFSRGPLARSLDPVALEALLQRPLLAAENAKSAPGRFPLIAIGLGLYYESPITFAALAEYLAGRGFVVVTVPLVGTNSALVRIDAQDLETQVRDLEFAVARARQLPFVRPDRLGVLGFDMGGMAGAILVMRDPSVDAFASLDSGILYPHPSGLPQASPSYDVAALRVPWLHAAPLRPGERPQDPSVKSLLDAAVHSNRYLLVTDGMGHVDFTSYALIEGRRAAPGYWAEAVPDAVHRHGIVADYVAHFFGAFLRTDAASVAWITRDPQGAFPGSQMTLEHRTATPPSIGYDELVQAIVRGDAETAIEKLRMADEADTKRVVLDQVHLERLGVSLLYTWGLAKEALPFLRYTAERYPASVQAQAILADGYVLIENYSAAIDILSKLVAQHPDNVGVRARLEQVRALQNSPRQ
jgi:dienelactone hydrolase